MVASTQTEIRSNGSRWGGQEPLPIEELFARLATHPLDRIFEAYGNFVEVDPVNMNADPLLPLGGVAFSGNFHTYSHVFDVRTTDPELIARLTAAIRENQQRPDYLSQPDAIERLAREESERQRRDTARNEERRRQLERELAALGDRTAPAKTETGA